jgi:hypothetical protein
MCHHVEGSSGFVLSGSQDLGVVPMVKVCLAGDDHPAMDSYRTQQQTSRQ